MYLLILISHSHQKMPNLDPCKRKPRHSKILVISFILNRLLDNKYNALVKGMMLTFLAAGGNWLNNSSGLRSNFGK